MTRRLVLRKETLAELTPGDLAHVRGGSVSFTIDTYLTYICTPLATAIVRAVTYVPGTLSVQDCPG